MRVKHTGLAGGGWERSLVAKPRIAAAVSLDNGSLGDNLAC